VKERLTGAIVLVVLIVLLVPELLSGPKGHSAPVPSATAPTSSEEPPLRSYTINLGDDSHSRSESAESSGPAMPQPSGPDQPTVQPGAPTSDASKEQSEAPPAAGSPAMSSQPAASTPPNSQAAGPPAANTQPPKSQAVSAPQPAHAAPAPRSEAPKPARAAAAAEKSPKTHPAATASAPSASESGWGVQLGVFASRENAERLALDVRVKGFKASVSPVTSGSRKLYRVRVGPTADRAAAQELQARLKAAGRPGGAVVPYS
jgi:cell division septation protein DedD